ncbi:hypothetical protein R2F61_01920 [Mollicutes bacterium LVI A0078]|nr:hypothetical protein RZE84_01930 [Mollicutes bacterium LVI A0075]WOO90509.1 hypothetical protein R2F61_07200 [Mollicutes bacterium LVI A0078]WOO91333.1 hypothetical protein R2F61_01920 [Mollicutes bacterium LVI A0078]
MKTEKESAGWKWSMLLIISLISIVVIKDIKEGNVTIEALTLITNEASRSVQLYGSIFGIVILGVLIMLLSHNKEKTSDLIPKLNKETKKIEKNEKTTELDLELLKLIGMAIIGLMMIILTPTLIDWLTNI